MDRDPDQGGVKGDRAARFYRVFRALQASGERGMTPEELGRLTGVSKRTAYRDLRALETGIGVSVWSEGGRFGVVEDSYLPAFRLTRDEAMAVFLSARLLARYSDRYDPDLAAAFQKLAQALPDVLGAHVERTVELMARRSRDDDAIRNVQDLTKAWAERRVVEFTYDLGTYDPSRGERHARVRPFLIEPSLATRSLYLVGFDETRGALRTFKIERISDLVLTPDTFESEDEPSVEERLGRAWDMIADQPPVDVVLRFSPAVAGRVLETTWHPSQEVASAPDGSLVWRASVSGTLEIRLWILSWGADVEVLEPAALREDVAGTLRAAADRYGRRA